MRKKENSGQVKKSIEEFKKLGGGTDPKERNDPEELKKGLEKSFNENYPKLVIPYGRYCYSGSRGPEGNHKPCPHWSLESELNGKCSYLEISDDQKGTILYDQVKYCGVNMSRYTVTEIGTDAEGNGLLDLNIFKDKFDIEKIKYYKLRDVGKSSLIITFYDENKKIIKGKK